MTATVTPIPTVATTMVAQIGHGNILAISGGRIVRVDENTIDLPVRYGYRVRVTYVPGRDTYDVARLFVRAGKTHVHGTATDVYAGQVGDAAYRASCYLDGPFGDAAEAAS